MKCVSVLLLNLVDCFRSMFGKLEQRLDANMVFDLFKPVYSPDGSNAKNMEEETMMYFIEFLQKCGTGGNFS